MSGPNRDQLNKLALAQDVERWQDNISRRRARSDVAFYLGGIGVCCAITTAGFISRHRSRKQLAAVCTGFAVMWYYSAMCAMQHNEIGSFYK